VRGRAAPDLGGDFAGRFRPALRLRWLLVDFRFRVTLLRLADTIFSRSKTALEDES
jgi:hypothetical protein